MLSPATRDLVQAVAPFLATALAALLATRVARRWNWLDGGHGAHKLPDEAWPVTGGAAVLAGVLAVWCGVEVFGRANVSFVPGRALASMLGEHLGREVTLWPFGALLTAFAVGSIDDWLEDGLSPALKLLGQGACGLVLAAPLWIAAPSDVTTYVAVTALVLGAAVALNCVNTFDNADGAALSIGLLGLAPGALPFAAALCGFAPFNLWRDGGRGWKRKAILGDSGSHLLGMMVLLAPAAWPVLLLPALDLARLSALRLRLGRAPWDGDRRHLAHRMARLGWGPKRVAASLALIAAPSAAGALIVHPAARVLGGALTTALYVLALRIAPPAPEPAAPRDAVATPRPTSVAGR